MKPLTRNILSAVWMENSFPWREQRRRGTSPTTVRSRVPTTNPLMTRCVSQLWWVTFPLRLVPPATRLRWRLAGCWGGPGAGTGCQYIITVQAGSPCVE